MSTSTNTNINTGTDTSIRTLQIHMHVQMRLQKKQIQGRVQRPSKLYHRDLTKLVNGVHSRKSETEPMKVTLVWILTTMILYSRRIFWILAAKL